MSMRTTLSKTVHPDTLIRISNATFFRHQPKTSLQENKVAKSQNDVISQGDPNPPLFKNLDFDFPADRKEYWAVISPSSGSRTSFLRTLRGEYLCFPPNARTYPYLSSDALAEKDASLRYPQRAIQYVGFDAERSGRGSADLKGAYLSARYESRREVTDFTLQDYLSGNIELNADQALSRHPNSKLMKKVTKSLNLSMLLDMPATQLSNGQTRRARIAKALLDEPELLLLDGPFMGLDPPTVEMLSDYLYQMAKQRAPRLFLSLSPGEHRPDWLTHLVITDEHYNVFAAGKRDDVEDIVMGESRQLVPSQGLETPMQELVGALRPYFTYKSRFQEQIRTARGINIFRKRLADDWVPSDTKDLANSKQIMSKDGFYIVDTEKHEVGEPVVEMDSVRVSYGEKGILGCDNGGLSWTVRRGERWGLFGANGSGKTTLLSMITSDHPQTYSQPVRLFGRSRLPEPGKPPITIFELQSRIGHSSPEVHAFFPRHLSVRRVLESAWADTPITKPRLTAEADDTIDRALRWFQAELHPTLGPQDWMEEEMKRFQYGEKHWGEEAHLGLQEKEKLGVYVLRRFRHVYNQEVVKPPIWADELRFGELSFSAQRVALFLRAIIKNPDIIVLDEAFSGMDSFTKDKCHLYLSHGETKVLRLYSRDAVRTLLYDGPRPVDSYLSRVGLAKYGGITSNQALVNVSHRMEEVPGCVRNWICLPQPGEGSVRKGKLPGPISMLADLVWRPIWDPSYIMPTAEKLLEPRPDGESPDGPRRPGRKNLAQLFLHTPDAIEQDKKRVDDLRQKFETYLEAKNMTPNELVYRMGWPLDPTLAFRRGYANARQLTTRHTAVVRIANFLAEEEEREKLGIGERTELLRVLDVSDTEWKTKALFSKKRQIRVSHRKKPHSADKERVKITRALEDESPFIKINRREGRA